MALPQISFISPQDAYRNLLFHGMQTLQIFITYNPPPCSQYFVFMPDSHCHGHTDAITRMRNNKDTGTITHTRNSKGTTSLLFARFLIDLRRVFSLILCLFLENSHYSFFIREITKDRVLSGRLVVLQYKDTGRGLQARRHELQTHSSFCQKWMKGIPTDA